MRANYLLQSEMFKLDVACRVVVEAFDGPGTFLVGSCLERRDYRDVDVRTMLFDDDFDRLFPGAAADPPRNATWALVCATLSSYLQAQTGLPVDYQIQRMTDANNDPQNAGKVRNAIGYVRWKRPEPPI